MIWRRLTPIAPSPRGENRDDFFPAFQHGELQTSPMTSLPLFGVAGKLQGHSHPLEVTHPNCSLLSIEDDNESRLCFPDADLPADDSSRCFHWQRGVVNLWLVPGFIFPTFPYPTNPVCLFFLGQKRNLRSPLQRVEKTGIKRLLPPPPAPGIPSS